MSEAATLWLPPATPADVTALLSTLSAPWCAEWLIGKQVLHASLATRSALRQLVWFGDAQVQVGCEAQARNALGMALCGGGADAANALDREFLGELAAAACTDLAIRLGARSSETERHETGPVAEDLTNCALIVPLGREWTLAIALSTEALNRLRRNAANGGLVPELGTIAAALTGERCRIGLHLGGARLCAAELAELEPGDVISLDRNIAEDLPLVIEGIRAKHGAARIDRSNGHLAVSITASVSTDALGVEAR